MARILLSAVLSAMYVTSANASCISQNEAAQIVRNYLATADGRLELGCAFDGASASRISYIIANIASELYDVQGSVYQDGKNIEAVIAYHSVVCREDIEDNELDDHTVIKVDCTGRVVVSEELSDD
ncbi:hypothetical protein [Ensifer aridi]|uniref:hypothetical protein n=1 Tax=Ensifer aridi TaxID=1708715 RepID=UPI000A119D7D|nr:hypothetical protein [Ensifer aridi]